MDFDYSQAFARNLGWITPAEAQILSQKKVVIAGVGGVGGHYCEVLTRLGIQNFHIADFDVFEIQNFNRQNGASMPNIGRKKTEVIAERIKSINPQANVKIFETGLSSENMNEFLDGADIYLDGLDVFVLKLRKQIFQTAYEKNIPVLTIGPLGMGASMLYFDRHSMSPTNFFGFKEDMTDLDLFASFLVGLTVGISSAQYMVDKSYLNAKEHKAPSTPMGCYLCAGIAGSMVLKCLLGRGEIPRAPHTFHFDAFKNTLAKKYLWWGHRNPIQMLRKKILSKMLQRST